MDLDDSELDMDGRSDEENRRKHQPISWNAWHKPPPPGDDHSPHMDPGYDRRGLRRDGPSSVIVKDAAGVKNSGSSAWDEQDNKGHQPPADIVDVNWLMEDEKEAMEKKKQEVRVERKRERSPSISRSREKVSSRTPPPPPGTRRQVSGLRPGNFRPASVHPRKRPFSRTGPFLQPRGQQPMMMRPPPRPQVHNRLPMQKMRMPSHNVPRRPSTGGMPPRAMPPGVGLRHMPRPFPRVANIPGRSIPPGYGPGPGKRGTRRQRSPPRMTDQWPQPDEPMYEDPRGDMARMMRRRPEDLEPVHPPPREARSAPVRERPPDNRRNWRAPSPVETRDVPVSRSPRRRTPRDIRISPPSSPVHGRPYIASPPRTRNRVLSPAPLPRVRRAPPWRERSRYQEPPPPPPRDVMPPVRTLYNQDRGVVSQGGIHRGRESGHNRSEPGHRRTDNIHRRGDATQRRSDTGPRRSEHESRGNTQMHLRDDSVSRKDPHIGHREDHGQAPSKDSHGDRRDSAQPVTRGTRHLNSAVPSQAVRDRDRDSPDPKRRALQRDAPQDRLTRPSGWDRREPPVERHVPDPRMYSSNRRPESHHRFVRDSRDVRERRRSESPRDYQKRPIDRSAGGHRPGLGRDGEGEGDRRHASGNGARPVNEFSHAEDECAWYYVDPQGSKQGPCTIEQFRGWLKTLAEDPQYKEEHKQFMSVNVWKEGMHNRYPMMVLLKENRPPSGRDRAWL